MQSGLANLHKNYDANLGTYEEVFGTEAAKTLEDCVRGLLTQPEFELTPIEVQRSLF